MRAQSRTVTLALILTAVAAGGAGLSLEAQDPPVDQLHLAIEAQEARVRDVLRTELVLKSKPSQDATVSERRTLQAADQG